MADQCHANNKRGNRCKRTAIPGGTVCRFHGGAAPQVKAAAERRLAETAAREAAYTFGLKIDTTPSQALLDEVQWTAGHVEWLRQQVHQLDPAALTFGVTRVDDIHAGVGKTGRNTTLEARTNGIVALYQKERDHLVRVCAAAIQCGLEERRVKLAEQQGQLVADAIRRILAELQLSDEQQARVPDVVPAVLRQLAAA